MKCAAKTVTGKSCGRPSVPFGDGTLCGLHYHANLRRSAPEEPPPPPPPPAQPEPAVRVLIIERKAAAAESLAARMRALGFDAVVASTLEEALAFLTKRDFALVLSDWIQVVGEPPWHAVDTLVRYARPGGVGLVTARPIPPEEAAAHGLRFVAAKPIVFTELLAQTSEYLARTVRPEVDAVIHKYFACCSHEDWDTLEQLCAPDIEYTLPGTDPRFAKTVKGRAEFRALSEAGARQCPGGRYTVDQLLPLPRGAIARYTGWWPGRAEPIPGSVLFCFDGELISELGVRLGVDADDID
jgi:CheY-like chemotaxis protein